MEDTLICRCEGVYLDEILKAIDDGATSVQGIKKRNRIGMGYCQGRTCQVIVKDILIQKTGLQSPKIQKSQAPVRPIPFGKL